MFFKKLIWLFSFISIINSINIPKTKYTGYMTYFNDPDSACGRKLNNNDLIVAIPDNLFENFMPKNDTNPNHNPICGKCIQIYGKKGIIKTKVYDRCGSCKNGKTNKDIDVRPRVFDLVTGKNRSYITIGKTKVTWRFC